MLKQLVLSAIAWSGAIENRRKNHLYCKKSVMPSESLRPALLSRATNRGLKRIIEYKTVVETENYAKEFSSIFLPHTQALQIHIPCTQRILPSAGVSATAVAAGDSHTCAKASGDGLWCWGWNGYGQLGIGSTAEQHSPVAVSLGAGILLVILCVCACVPLRARVRLYARVRVCAHAREWPVCFCLCLCSRVSLCVCARAQVCVCGT